MKASSPPQKDLSSSSNNTVADHTEGFAMEPSGSRSPWSEKGQLEYARAKTEEVREENRRLKAYLDQMMKDYHTLQLQFHDLIQQEEKRSMEQRNNGACQNDEELELVSLTLGRSMEKEKRKASSKEKEGPSDLGLDCKFDVPLQNQSQINNITSEDTRPPSKVLKTMRNGDDDEILQQNPAKKVRVCVRARCDTPTVNDGCQWRKYGQKMSKGNPCPRAYYRCTIATSCPVRKQVQRCAEDMSILITTYEGTHNHPLSVSATAMASATSAAASMLLSGSSSSTSEAGNYIPSTFSTPINFHELNHYLYDNMKTKSSTKFYLPNPTFSTSSSHHPTITLDLTCPPFSSSSSLFNKSSFSSNLLSQSYLKNPIGNCIDQSLMQKNIDLISPPSQPRNSDIIEAATKAVTTDPSFQSALAAALSSMIEMGSTSTRGTTQVTDVLKLREQLVSLSTTQGNGCASSSLNNSPPSNV